MEEDATEPTTRQLDDNYAYLCDDVLTLKNFDGKTIQANIPQGYSGLQINLEGTNTLTPAAAGGEVCGISVSGNNLRIIGNGALQITINSQGESTGLYCDQRMELYASAVSVFVNNDIQPTQGQGVKVKEMAIANCNLKIHSGDIGINVNDTLMIYDGAMDIQAGSYAVLCKNVDISSCFKISVPENYILHKIDEEHNDIFSLWDEEKQEYVKEFSGDTKHEWESQWRKDEDGHWHECANCSTQIDYGAHESIASCSICNPVTEDDTPDNPNKGTFIESIAMEGITDGKVSQEMDTVESYKLNIKTKETELPRIGVEVIPADGYSKDSIKAEIVDGSLKLTTAPMMAAENVAVIKIYEETEEQYSYIEGGTFTVSVSAPSKLVNTDVQAEVSKKYDVAFTLSLHVTGGVNELVAGKYYYKVEVTPKGTDIPEDIVRATAKPQYFEKNPYDYQDIKVIVNENDYGDGQAWKYDMKVSLVQTNGKDIAEDAKNILYESKKAEVTNLETLKPHFTEKITFDGITNQIYTGQTSVAIAEFVLDEGTSYPDVENIEDITELNGKGSALQVYHDGTLVFVNVPTDAMIGKHTVEVTIGGPKNMNPTKGTYVINVVKGIERLDISVPSVSVYKPAKKAVTIKPVLTINQGTTAPKSKNVTWEIVKPDGNPFVQGDFLYGKLTVKNGQITVSKDFVPSEKEQDNQFRVKVTAADYESSDVSCQSDVITLKNQPAEIGAVYVLTQTEGGYKVVVKNSSSVTTDQLDHAFVAVLKKGAEGREFYTEEELSRFMISPEILNFKASNKALSVKKSDKVTLSASKTLKNVTLTASTTDGGKKNGKLKFTIKYATPEALALEVLGQTDTKTLEFAGTTNTRLTVKVKEKVGESWVDLKALSNYKLSITNGKIVTSDMENGIYEVIVTSKTATITLDNKSTGKSVKEKYYITNTAYSEAKAPKVKTSQKLLAGSTKNRSITYALSGNYKYNGKYVFVETDYISKTKNKALYDQFETAAENMNTVIPISTDGKFTLEFNESSMKAGSYKLKLTFGNGANEDNFVAETKPVTVTLKAVTPKVVKGSYSPVTSYKLEAKAGSNVVLTGKGKKVVQDSLSFNDLKNANIAGKQNEFLKYFELKNGSLGLRSDLSEEDILYLKSTKGKNHLTGYVSYTVSYGDNGYGEPYNTVSKSVKLTIKLK